MGIAYSGTAASGFKPSAVAPPPLASLVVRTFNEAEHLGSLLDQVRVQQLAGGRGIEVIVVDSGSTDGTDEIALGHGARLIRIAKHEFSFGRALNIGCEASSGEFLVCISGHCIPCDGNWLDRLLAPFRDPGVAMTYGRQVGASDSKFSECRVYEKYYPAGEASQGPAFCNNANSAIRKGIWRRFRFDEALTGLEDIEFGRRLVAARFRIAYAPEACVVHIHRESWPQVRRRYEREAIALRHIHPEFHLGGLEAAQCFLAAVWKDAVSALARRTLPATLAEIFHYRYNQFLGSWLGNRPHRELSTREKMRYFFPS